MNYQGFGFEERLQELLALHPYLLDGPTGSASRLLLGREVPLFGASVAPGEGPAPDDETSDVPGRVDLAFVEKSGLPCLVEVKLSDNDTMGRVLEQGLGYVNGAFANPSASAWALRSTFGRLAERFPGGRSVFRRVSDFLPGWDPDKLRLTIETFLRDRRCRLVIAADVLPLKIVQEAERLRPSLGNIQLDLINVSRGADGELTARVVTESALDYAQRYRPPAPAPRVWEDVPREPVQASDFMKKMVMDRFYNNKAYPECRFDYRIRRIKALPALLRYEASPGRAPVGDLHQIERSRRESCAPVMPNLLLRERTNNPYPRSGDDRSVVTDPSYRDLTRICHATWDVLKEKGSLELKLDKERSCQKYIIDRAGYKLSHGSPLVQLVALGAPFDTMRDCALFGLVQHSRMRHTEHRFELVPPPSKLVPFP